LAASRILSAMFIYYCLMYMGASLPIGRLACGIDTVQVVATRVRVIAIRNPTLRMQALLDDYRFSCALILVSPTKICKSRVTGLS